MFDKISTWFSNMYLKLNVTVLLWNTARTLSKIFWSVLWCIYSSIWKWSCWLALEILLFFKQLLSFCLLKASQLFYISYTFIKPILFAFYLSVHVFSSYFPSLLFFSLWLFPNKLLQILSPFSEIIAYLCKRIYALKKYHPWGIFILWQLGTKNSVFCSRNKFIVWQLVENFTDFQQNNSIIMQKKLSI